MSKERGAYAYFLTLLFAMGLNIMSLPDMVTYVNPDWVLLILIYWTLAMPERFGVISAWVLGLFVDVLTGRLMGMHGLTYALVSYLCLRFHKRLRQYPIPQQSIFILFALLLSQSLIFWIDNIQNTSAFYFSFWLPVLIGTIAWPFVYVCLRFIRLFGGH